MKKLNMPLTNRLFRDLNPVVAGYHICDPGHTFGPHIRRYVLLHYVHRGKGYLFSRGQMFQIRAGQVFVILDGEVTTYMADKEEPWHYHWVGFDGRLARRFHELPPVFSMNEEEFMALFPPEGYPNPECWLAGGLMRLYGSLFAGEDRGNLHVQRTENRICSSYMEPLRVEAIAREMNLDRRYLSRLFKEKTGKTVQEYLIHVRMEEADQCLRQGHSVQDTARLCGYEDAANFSRMYKKHFGHSPIQSKRSAKE